MRLELRQAQKPARLLQYVAERMKTAGAGDHIEQVAMLAGRKVDLMCNCT